MNIIMSDEVVLLVNLVTSGRKNVHPVVKKCCNLCDAITVNITR
jgi:hypothetical protein